MAVQPVRVTELAHLERHHALELAEHLAQRHTAEWGALYDPEVWNREIARREFHEHIEFGGGGAPTTYVALTERGQCLGSVSLVASDDLTGFEHLGPWMASLYVEPSHRRRGVGRLLVRHVLDQPCARDAGRLYLFTSDHEAWYHNLGWRPFAATLAGPHARPVRVMWWEAPGRSPYEHRLRHQQGQPEVGNRTDIE